MSHTLSRFCRAFALIGAIASPSVALAISECEEAPDGVGCDLETVEGRYCLIYGPGMAVPQACPAPDPGVFTTYKLASTKAPDPAHLFCEYGSNNYFCEAWPQDEDPETSSEPKLTYGWSVTGGVTIPTPGSPTTPARIINCNGMGTSGTITVNVSSPYGFSASRTVSVHCRP